MELQGRALEAKGTTLAWGPVGPYGLLAKSTGPRAEALGLDRKMVVGMGKASGLDQGTSPSKLRR